MKRPVLTTLALLGSLAFAPTANAAEAAVSANVRSGPGTSYRIVDRLFRGENVNVRRCRSNGWCYITTRVRMAGYRPGFSFPTTLTTITSMTAGLA